MNTNYRNRCLVLSCLVLGFAQAAPVSVFAAEANEIRGQLSAADYKFAKAAASGGMMEVSLGKLAADKSLNPAVRQFGQRMVTDHGKVGQDLAKIASSKGASLPSEPTAVQQKETERLVKLTGPEFDKAYVTLMVRDHKADQKEFKRASEDTQDPELKAFAATTLTVIQDHLKIAEDLAESLKHEVSMGK
jgi:putative membrane protein